MWLVTLITGWRRRRWAKAAERNQRREYEQAKRRIIAERHRNQRRWPGDPR